MSMDERTRAVATLDAILDFGKQLAKDHHRRMPFPSFDSARAVILTLFAAAHRSAGAAAELLRCRWADEAQVIGRSAFEHVVYAYLVNHDDRQRRLFVHYGASLGRWDEIDAYLRVFPDTDQSLLAPARSQAHQASLRAVEDLVPRQESFALLWPQPAVLITKSPVTHHFRLRGSGVWTSHRPPLILC